MLPKAIRRRFIAAGDVTDVCLPAQSHCLDGLLP